MKLRKLKTGVFKKIFIQTALIGITVRAAAQSVDGNNGISQANTMIRGYYQTATDLMYGIGAILAIIGALRVYQLWGSRDGQAERAAAGWFGSCVFLVVVSTVIKSFFSI